MSLLRKNLLVLVLLLFVYSWYFLSHSIPTQKSISVSGESANVSLSIEPQAGRSVILDEINSAKSEILVEVYLLSDKTIIGALKDAKAKGISVDVMLEEHPFGGGSLNNTTEKELVSAGISVEWSNPAFSLTHEKAIIIDGKKAFILSQNLTSSSFSKNREYDILDTNVKDVEEIRTIFIDDWQRKSFTQSSPNLVISPNSSRKTLTSLIQNSTKSIDIEIEDIEDRDIISLLSSKAKTIPVRLIVPTLSQINSNSTALLALQKEGVLIKTLASPYMHAKLILSDNTKAFVGSVNLSTQSLDKNRELGIILSEQEIIKKLSDTFSSDWNKGNNFLQK